MLKTWLNWFDKKYIFELILAWLSCSYLILEEHEKAKSEPDYKYQEHNKESDEGVQDVIQHNYVPWNKN